MSKKQKLTHEFSGNNSSASVGIRSNHDLQLMSGENDEFLDLVRNSLGVSLSVKECTVIITGKTKDEVERAGQVIQEMSEKVRTSRQLTEAEVKGIIDDYTNNDQHPLTVGKLVTFMKTGNQAKYVGELKEHDITFATGPAGTGKTHVALVMACLGLQTGRYEKIILCRPAKEAGGEKLGFLPGDYQEKVDPYMRPFYDIMKKIFGAEELKKKMDDTNGDPQIEVCPLAFMRGRTLDNSFIIVDESQNTTPDLMYMMLTRIGKNSKMAVTGDLTQNDLGKGVVSGLDYAMRVFADDPDYGFVTFTDADVIRSPRVADVIRKWTAYEQKPQPQSQYSNGAPKQHTNGVAHPVATPGPG